MTCSDSRNFGLKLLCEPSRLQITFSFEISLVREPAVSQSSYGILTFSLV